jgi:succinyl-CoA synthetase beta subunit
LAIDSHIVKLRDTRKEDPREVEASRYNLNYFFRDGNIACLVNRAGRAMTTMDLIMYHWSKPGNFLDIGGGANEEQIIRIFEFY